jgi:very-long-chain ceramide synthase
LLRRWKKFSFTHTWVNPLILIIIILLLYAANPTESNPLHRAIFLSYPLARDDPLIPDWARNDPEVPTYYGKGKADLAFVSFYIIVLSFTREFLMQRIIRPLAIACGIKSRSKQSRFMEQVYTAVYFSVFGPFGLYVMSRTPIGYFNTDAMYESFPHRSHDGVFKAYYLLQASYWAQQAIVLLLGLEKPRKDFKELVAHHVVTLALIALSYRFHFTYMGIAVYVTHDISDFFLAVREISNSSSSYIADSNRLPNHSIISTP